MQAKGPAFLAAFAADPKKGGMCLFGFGLIPLIITACWCGFYWDMWADAMTINELELPEKDKNGVLPYDACLGAADEGLGRGLQSGFVMDTQWTTLLAFNSILYLLFSIFIVCLMISYFVGPFVYIGACGLCCSGCANLACIITTGVLRYSAEGKLCALGYAAAAEFSDEITDVGARIEGLFISQCVLFCFLGCCIGALTQVAIGLMMVKKAKAAMGM